MSNESANRRQSTPTFDKDAIVQHLGLLMEPYKEMSISGMFLAIAVDSPERGFREKCYPVDDGKIDVKKILAHLSKVNPLSHVYVAPNLLSVKKKTQENVGCVGWLYTDYDLIKNSKEEEIEDPEQHVMDQWSDYRENDLLMKLPPTMWVYTGGGFHAYWRIDKEDTAERERARLSLASLVEAQVGIHADKAVKDLSRYLRLAGTLNAKYRGAPRVFVLNHEGFVYNLDDIERVVGSSSLSVQNKEERKKPKTRSEIDQSYIRTCITDGLSDMEIIDNFDNNPPTTKYKEECERDRGEYYLRRSIESGRNWVNLHIEKAQYIEKAILGAMKNEDNLYEKIRVLEDYSDSISRIPARTRELFVDRIRKSSGLKQKIVNDVVQTACKKKGKPQISTIFKGLVDIVEAPDKKYQYLIIRDGKLALEDTHESKKGNLIPPEYGNDLITWPVPMADGVLNSREYLSAYRDCIDRLRHCVYFPDDDVYHLLACWVIHTYLIDIGPIIYSPIIFAVGPVHSGKSRLINALVDISYRGKYLTKFNDAHIIRFYKELSSMIGLDMKSMQKSLNDGGALDIILNRFQFSGELLKVMDPKVSIFEGSVSYNNFGATALASNLPVCDELADRSITFAMDKNKIAAPPMPDFRSDDLVNREIREKLTLFRANIMRGSTKLELPQNIPFEHRQKDIMKPLIMIVRHFSSSNENKVIDAARPRLFNEQDREEAHVARSKAHRHRDLETERVRELLARKFSDRDMKFVEVDEIKKVYEDEYSEISHKKMSNILQRLGLEHKKSSSGKNPNRSMYMIDNNRIKPSSPITKSHDARR